MSNEAKRLADKYILEDGSDPPALNEEVVERVMTNPVVPNEIDEAMRLPAIELLNHPEREKQLNIIIGYLRKQVEKLHGSSPKAYRRF
jgi:hypothetical protein